MASEIVSDKPRTPYIPEEPDAASTAGASSWLDALRQNCMAFGMLVLYLLIVPVVFLISILLTGLVAMLDPRGQSPLWVIVSDRAHLLIWFAAVLLFFGATYRLRIQPGAGAGVRGDATGGGPLWLRCC